MSRNTLSNTLPLAFALALASAVGGAAAQGTNSAPAPAPAPAQGNAIAQAGLQAGMQACAARMGQITQFLGFGAQSGALLMRPPDNPNQRLIPLAMEIPTESGAAYVSAHFAPNQANGCGAAYDAVVYWPLKCDEVASRQFSAMKKIAPLKKDIAVLDGGPATKVFLMPAGNGCVSIKKEVVL